MFVPSLPSHLLHSSLTSRAATDGFDSYPQSFDCSRPSYWKPVLDTYNAYHRKANPSQPLYIPECKFSFRPVLLLTALMETICREVQAGAFDPWGPAAPGYEKCRTLTASDFESGEWKLRKGGASLAMG